MDGRPATVIDGGALHALLSSLQSLQESSPYLLPLLVLAVPPFVFWCFWEFYGCRQARLRRLELDAFMYLWPALLILTTFHLIPVVYSFLLSLHDASAQDPFHTFVGLQNYRRLLGDAFFRNLLQGDSPTPILADKVFLTSLVNTAWYSILTVVLSIALGLVVALLLNQKLKGVGFYRTTYFLPVVTSVAAVSLVWKLLYHPQRGVLNRIADAVGLPELSWLQEGRGVFDMFFTWVGLGWPEFLPDGPSLALVSVVLMSVWKGFGYNVVLFLAGLQNIPEELYEAATIDGAGPWKRFWHITWPLLSPMTFFVLIMSTIRSFQVFAQIFMLYAGNATETSRVIVYYLYEKAFQAFDLGYASAVAYVLFLIIFTMTQLQKRFVGSRVHYANSPT